MNFENNQIPEKVYPWWDLVIVSFHTFIIILSSILYTENLLLNIIGIILTCVVVALFLFFFKKNNPFISYLSFSLTIPVFVYATPLYMFYLGEYLSIGVWDLIFPFFIFLAVIDSYLLFKRYNATDYSPTQLYIAFRNYSTVFSTPEGNNYYKWLNEDFKNEEKQKKAKDFLESFYKYNYILITLISVTIIYIILTILNYIAM
jgi:hypothetical protein